MNGLLFFCLYNIVQALIFGLDYSEKTKASVKILLNYIEILLIISACYFCFFTEFDLHDYIDNGPWYSTLAFLFAFTLTDAIVISKLGTKKLMGEENEYKNFSKFSADQIRNYFWSKYFLLLIAFFILAEWIWKFTTYDFEKDDFITLMSFTLWVSALVIFWDIQRYKNHFSYKISLNVFKLPFLFSSLVIVYNSYSTVILLIKAAAGIDTTDFEFTCDLILSWLPGIYSVFCLADIGAALKEKIEDKSSIFYEFCRGIVFVGFLITVIPYLIEAWFTIVIGIIATIIAWNQLKKFYYT